MSAMSPPTTHAVKNRVVLPAAPATIAGVRKMPIPTTRLNTTIAVSNVVSRALIPPEPALAAMQCFHEQIGQTLELLQIVVELSGDPKDWHWLCVQPGLDPAL